jgi:CHAD domain-containing protein
MTTFDVGAVSLQPSMPAIDGFGAVLSNLADAVAANWQGTIDRRDPEFLHDLRIAVRRTRTVVVQGRHVLPAAAVAAARQQFGALGDLTGPARDLDVLLTGWDDATSGLDASMAVALNPVRDLLELRRGAAVDSLQDGLRSDETVRALSRWRMWLGLWPPAEPSGRDADRPLGGVVAKRIRRLDKQIIELGRSVDAQTADEQVHELRKSAKKLRYLLECFGDLAPKSDVKAFVRRLKVIQDSLGEHQDVVVHTAQIDAAARAVHQGGASFETMRAVGQLVEQLNQRHRRARARFVKQFGAYDSKATRRALEAVLDDISG